MMKKFNYKLLENIEGDNWKSLENKSLKIRNITKSLIFSNKYFNIYICRIFTLSKDWDKNNEEKFISIVKINGRFKNISIKIPLNYWFFIKLCNFKKAAFLTSFIMLDEDFLKIEILKNSSKTNMDLFPSKVIYTVPEGKTPLDYVYLPWYCTNEIIE